MDQSETPVSIVCATCNGAAYLEAQLTSLLQQDHNAWQIILSDDGSVDETVAIARALISKKRLRIVNGPQTGLALNFWHGLMQVPEGHFVAFCDQDDVWHANKLSRAFGKLGAIEEPALYTSGRLVADQDLLVQNTQPRRSVRHFAQLLFRNPVAGHTCMLNPQAVDVLKRFPPARNVPFHDWWAALVLKGIDAHFVHDPVPTLLYRQHTANVIGAQTGRAKLILNGTYLRWVRSNYAALWQVRDQLTPSARHVLRVCLPLRAGLRLAQR